MTPTIGDSHHDRHDYLHHDHHHQHQQQHLTRKIALALIAISLHCSFSSGLSIDQREVSSQALVIEGGVASKRLPASSSPTAAPEAVASNATTLTGRVEAQHRSRNDNRRPIWALAHMVNSIKELDYRLSSGANAIEADVTFGPDGSPLWTYHGPPCDCWRHCYQREDFHDFLAHVREIAIDTSEGAGQNLSILFLDLKLDPLDQLGKARAGRELAKAVMGNLFMGQLERSKQLAAPSSNDRKSLIYLILSINHVNDIDLVNNFLHTLEMSNASHHLMPQIGFDVGMNDDVQLIESMWRKFGSTLNLWQGDGYTNCLSPFYNLQRLSEAIAKRDQQAGYPAKVYHWTIDLHDRIRESLLLGVDAIMSNHPERLLTVLQEPEIAHELRLATREDNPFKKLTTRRSTGRSGETARFQRSANSNTGGFLGNFMDILASWYNYIREIPLLSFPTTILKSGFKRTTQANNQTTKLDIISPVKLPTGPEYKLENVSAPATTNETLDTIDRSINPDQKQAQDLEYQPTWYVSLVSNLLVSALRSVLPS